jgi:hypothetical protein
MENAIYSHLTNTTSIIGGSFLFLLIIFALVAFHDKHRTTTALPRRFDSDGKPCASPQSFGRDGKNESSALYSRRADLCTCRLGTSEQQICFRGEKVQNLTGD